MLACMGRDEMRAADADRQAVADGLRDALDEGRLDLHEYDERLRQAYAARTYGELELLTADLPVPAVAPRDPAAVSAVRGATGRWLLEVWSVWVSVVALTVVIWAVVGLAGGEFGYFWPMWVAGPWGAVLVWASIAGVAAGEPQKRAAKRARKAEARQQRRDGGTDPVIGD